MFIQRGAVGAVAPDRWGETVGIQTATCMWGVPWEVLSIKVCPV